MADRGYIIYDAVTGDVLTNYPKPLQWHGWIDEGNGVIQNAHMFSKKVDAKQAVKHLARVFEKEPGGVDLRIVPVSEQPSYKLEGNWYDIMHRKKH